MLISKARGLVAALVSCVMPLAASTLPVTATGVFTVVADAGTALAQATLRPRGNWVSTTNYVLNDVVSYRNSSWRALRPSTGKVPGSTAPSTALDWQLFVGGLDPLGTWNSATTYQRNDLVVVPPGSAFRALHTNINKVPGQPGNAADWQLFVAKGATGATGPQGPQGVQGVPGSTAVANGSVAAPAFKFTSSPDTGIFSPSGGKIALAENGALFLHDIGDLNTALGLGALGLNTSGSQNTALGAAALGSNDTGSNNTAVGLSALGGNSSGSSNTALGRLALNVNIDGSQNTAVGDSALLKNKTDANTAVGFEALRANTTGNSNTAVGNLALRANISGFQNTAVGREALVANTGGFNNTALGYSALSSSIGAHDNTAAGVRALGANTTGNDSTAVGAGALSSNSTGDGNIAIGSRALGTNTSGNGNVAIGLDAGEFATNPSQSIFIRNGGLEDDTFTIKIGSAIQTSAFIGGIRGQTTGVADAVAVLIDSNGQLGTVNSSRRYKEDIHSMGAMSDMLSRLRPVSFRYKKPYADGSKPIQYGLIAEEVAETFPYLAVFNADGQPETVKYHELPAFLLEGFQEQQRVIVVQAEELREQRATIDAQAQRMAEMEARLAAIEAMLQRPTMTTASDSRS